jgi:hypothetical protein
METFGTSDDHDGDGERSASVKSINQLMNDWSYCRLTEWMFSKNPEK